MKMTVEFNSIADLANFSKFIDQRLEEETKARELDNLRGQLDMAKQQLERAYARLRFKDDDDKDKTYKILIADLPLKVRTHNCLISAGCQTVGDVMALGELGLARITNFGKGSFKDLKQVFAEHLKINFERK